MEVVATVAVAVVVVAMVVAVMAVEATVVVDWHVCWRARITMCCDAGAHTCMQSTCHSSDAKKVCPRLRALGSAQPHAAVLVVVGELVQHHRRRECRSLRNPAVDHLRNGALPTSAATPARPKRAIVDNPRAARARLRQKPPRLS